MKKNVLILMLIFIAANTRAQNVGIGTITPQASFTVAANKTVLFGADTLNAGTKMMWLPAKGAFRVGTVEADNWNPDSIGVSSFALGYNAKAKGVYSTAMGHYTTASGTVSNAMGYYTTASGTVSTAMGCLTKAIGDYSTAMGYYSTASGDYSTAMGHNTTASGTISTAMGYATTASGYASTAMGLETKAIGNFSTAMGYATVAKAYGSFAAGGYNDSIVGSSPVNWVATDPLFYIGNGTENALHNAMVVYKNGNMVLKNPTAVLSNPASFTVPINGEGTRMMWLPEKGAFRVGTVDGGNWDANKIGTWSFASGYSTIASGLYSTAMGYYTEASGDFSTAMGSGTASGLSSVAMGDHAKAIGLYSTAMGNYTQASGQNSTAMGYSTTAASYISTAIGRYNDTIAGSNSTSFIATDPLFYIGNGLNNSARTNALVVYKNGNTDINGYTRLGKASEAAPKIKMKELTGTTDALKNGSVAISLGGVDPTKIISVSTLVGIASNAVWLPNGYDNDPRFKYNYYVHTNGNIYIQNQSSDCISAGDHICNKTVKIVVTYKE